MIDSDTKTLVLGSGGLAGGGIMRSLRKRGFGRILSPRSSELDLRNQRDVDDYFKLHRPQHVYLAAAMVGGIMANKTRKAEFLYDNLMIQSNVIEASYYNGVEKLLFLGTSCIYPAGRQHPLKEEELMTGPLEPTNDAYAIAKIAGIKMCDAYREQYGFNAISLMPPNLYGPGDNFDENSGHVMASLIKKFHSAMKNNDSSVTCWGDGSPMREFLFVDDLAESCIFFMDVWNRSGPLNVGTGKDITIKELAETIAEVVGFKGEIVWDTTKPNGNPRKLLDSSRAHELEWYPSYTLKEGIEETYEWYLKTYEL
jgi:GDP-L-fucose synthase